jgi:hypothetical protein
MGQPRQIEGRDSVVFPERDWIGTRGGPRSVPRERRTQRRNPEVGRADRVHEDCPHGNQQQTCQAEEWGVFYNSERPDRGAQSSVETGVLAE